MERHPAGNPEATVGLYEQRALAYVLDWIVIFILTPILGFSFGLLASVGDLEIALAAAFFTTMFGLFPVYLLYFITTEGIFGQSVGKRVVGIVVVSDDGSPVGWLGTIVRNLLRIIDVLPSFYIIGFVASQTNERDKRVGDMAGGTVVVETQA